MENKANNSVKDSGPGSMLNNPAIGFRYIVHDVDAAVEFYTGMLGFKLEMKAGGGFAILSKGGIYLFLNKPGFGGAGASASDGSSPEPGGWNRIQFQVDNLEKLVEELRANNAQFKSEIIVGNGGNQILLQDPSGNLVELFEPKK